MPQVLSIRPTTPQPATPASLDSQQSDSGFDFQKLLDGARSKESATPPLTIKSNPKPAKVKTTKPKPQKPADNDFDVKSDASDTDDADATHSTDQQSDSSTTPTSKTAPVKSPQNAKTQSKKGEDADQEGDPKRHVQVQQPGQLQLPPAPKGDTAQEDGSAEDTKDVQPQDQSTTPTDLAQTLAGATASQPQTQKPVEAPKASQSQPQQSHPVATIGDDRDGQAATAATRQTNGDVAKPTNASPDANNDDESQTTARAVDSIEATPVPKTTAHSSTTTFADTLAGAQAQTNTPATTANHVVGVQQPAPSPEVQFADVNHPKIVTGVHGQLLPNGGSMQLRLDPPELGTLSVQVHMRDGVMTATFETANDQAAQLLSHSLGDLKNALESQGVSVAQLHVQTAREPSTGNNNQGQHNGDKHNLDDSPQRQEQQRREMLRRMWRRVSGDKDPLDLVA